MIVKDILERGSGPLISEVHEKIAWIVFNNPQRMNAMSQEMWDNAASVLDKYGSNPEVRAIVLTGAGERAFVAGADISKFETERASAEAMASYNQSVANFHDSLNVITKPTIARVNGYCIGGGLAIAIGCDIRICSEKSQFAMPAAKLSLRYPFSSIKRLFDIMGPGMAKHFMFTAERISSKEAIT